MGETMRTTRIGLLALLAFGGGAACLAPSVGRLECRVRSAPPAADVSAGCLPTIMFAVGDKGVGCALTPGLDQFVYMAASSRNVDEVVSCVADAESGQLYRTPYPLDLSDGNFDRLRNCTHDERAIALGVCN